MLDKLNQALQDAEEAERILSYVSVCGSERARKLSGSYYTPIDVARFFWNEYFHHSNLRTSSDAIAFVEEHKFVEPSVGAGALFFALLERLALAGLTPAQVSKINAELVDVNKEALEFIQEAIAKLEHSLAVDFSNLRFTRVDFRKADFAIEAKPIVFFGNPPFVANEKGASPWKNLFADFLDKCLYDAGETGSVHLILPISIAFSRDYRALRQKLCDRPRKVALSHFDNIPDTLFKAGKPFHDNTNKANSQRCSILTVLPSDSRILLSTKLHRWSKKERARILGISPQYLRVTDYRFDDQIPRPENLKILRYLKNAGDTSIGNLIHDDGKYSLFVAGVARNYIGIREVAGSGVHELKFKRQVDFFSALNLLASDLFHDYWLTIGDGFHITKSNVFDFPISQRLSAALVSNLHRTKRVWNQRDAFAKSKMNSGVPTASYDFSNAFGSLYERI